MSWTHHAELQGLPAQRQDQWLDAAESEGLSKGRLRIAVQDEKTVELLKSTKLPSGMYNVIYADPPWRPIDGSSTDSRRIENHYPTMDLPSICNLPVDKVTHDDAVLFLWTTAPKCDQAFEVIVAWGFTYKTQLVWAKPSIGTGYYVRQQHELILIATRGNPRTPPASSRPRSIVSAPRTGRHSGKPELFYELIESMYPHATRIELFARATRPGWDSWGNEVPRRRRKKSKSG